MIFSVVMSNGCRDRKSAGLTVPLMGLIVKSNSCKRKFHLSIARVFVTEHW